MTTPAHVRAVSFDVDDTLIDYSVSVPHSLRAVFGPRADADVWQSLTDTLYPRYLTGELTHRSYLRARTAAMLATMDRAVPDAVELDLLERRRKAAAEARLRLYPDVSPCLGALRDAGFALAVLSNADGAEQRGRLEAVGLAGMFDALVLSGETGVAKPDPAAFQCVRASLGVADHGVAHVGDDLVADSCGALGAGFVAILIDRGDLVRQTPANVVRVLDLREVPRLLGVMVETTRES